jgi:hypothetical protein
MMSPQHGQRHDRLGSLVQELSAIVRALIKQVENGGRSLTSSALICR